MSFLQRVLEDPVRLRRLRRGGCAVLALIVAAEAGLPRLFPGGHHHFGFEGFPAFGSLYGFASCVVIIVGSKLIGKAGIMRKEDPHES